MAELNNNTEKFVFEKDAVYVLPEVDISGIMRKFLDVPYASNSEFQKFDLYLPNGGDGPFPLVVFIHGGGWRRGDKRDTQIQGFMKLLDKGYAIASINWRLSFEAHFPACIQDCKAAIRYIKAHASELRINPTRLAIAGGSAGAHIALMLATTEGISELEDLSMGNADQDTTVQCVVVWFSATDLANIYAQALENEKIGIINISDNSWDNDDPQAPSALLLGDALNRLNPEYIDYASPIHHINSNMPPVLLQHGKIDFTVPCQQSINFYEKARAVVGDERVQLDILETAIHMDSQFETAANMERVEAFLSKYLK